jgi:hypothetical protein
VNMAEGSARELPGDRWDHSPISLPLIQFHAEMTIHNGLYRSIHMRVKDNGLSISYPYGQ